MTMTLGAPAQGICRKLKKSVVPAGSSLDQLHTH